MTGPISHFDDFIHQEMLVHPVFFTHKGIKAMAIIGQQLDGVTTEALKHVALEECWQVTANYPEHPPQDTRVKVYVGDTANWLTQIAENSLDCIVLPDKEDDLSDAVYQSYLQRLQAEGIFIQHTHSLFETEKLTALFTRLHALGFHDLQVLNFPQPSSPLGWRSAIMATKTGLFKRAREKDIYNKTFTTRYYNYDVHKASLVLPEFMRTALTL